MLRWIMIFIAIASLAGLMGLSGTQLYGFTANAAQLSPIASYLLLGAKILIVFAILGTIIYLANRAMYQTIHQSGKA